MPNPNYRMTARPRPGAAPSKKQKTRRRKSRFGGQFSLPMILICIAFLALFIGIAVLTHIKAGKGSEVFSFASDGHITVCIDPGHGYDDPGALSDYTDGLYEKDINLTLSLALAEKLRELGYEVIMTRESDIVPEDMEGDERGLYILDPNERTAWVNGSEADLFISLHCNVAEGSPGVTGTQIYYCSSALPESEEYAQLLCDTMRADMPGRSFEPMDTRRSSSFAVIRDIGIPSVLVETGFISSPADSVLLCDPAWQDDFTSALANGISRYISANSEE